MLPHKFTEFGPALVVGDIDGNGLDDLVAGGSTGNGAMAILQKPDGSFRKKPLLPNANPQTIQWKDAGMALFDADADGDLDLFTAGGGFAAAPIPKATRIRCT